MSFSDWVMIVAVLAGPIAAVQVQDLLNLLREKRRRKMAVFQTLMATRAARVSVSHVQALNSIDIEFGGAIWFGRPRPTPAERLVLETWKSYQDHLNDRESDLASWGSRGHDLFVELLYQMSKSLGYTFDKVQLRKGIYTPVAHGQLEQDTQTIRKSLIEIMSGTRPVPITVIPPELASNSEMQEKLLDGMLQLVEGQKPLRVTIEDNSSIK